MYAAATDSGHRSPPISPRSKTANRLSTTSLSVCGVASILTPKKLHRSVEGARQEALQGRFQPLISLARYSNVDILQDTAWAFADITKDAQCCQFLVEYGGLDSVVNLTLRQETSIREYALISLVNMAMQVGNYKSVGQSASAVLIQLLQSEDANPRLAGIQAMARVAENSNNLEHLHANHISRAVVDAILLSLESLKSRQELSEDAISHHTQCILVGLHGLSYIFAYERSVEELLLLDSVHRDEVLGLLARVFADPTNSDERHSVLADGEPCGSRGDQDGDQDCVEQGSGGSSRLQAVLAREVDQLEARKHADAKGNPFGPSLPGRSPSTKDLSGDFRIDEDEDEDDDEEDVAVEPERPLSAPSQIGSPPPPDQLRTSDTFVRRVKHGDSYPEVGESTSSAIDTFRLQQREGIVHPADWSGVKASLLDEPEYAITSVIGEAAKCLANICLAGGRALLVDKNFFDLLCQALEFGNGTATMRELARALFEMSRDGSAVHISPVGLLRIVNVDDRKVKVFGAKIIMNFVSDTVGSGRQRVVESGGLEALISVSSSDDMRVKKICAEAILGMCESSPRSFADNLASLATTVLSLIESGDEEVQCICAQSLEQMTMKVPAFRRQLLEGEKFELVLDLLHGENYNTMLSVLCTLRNVSLQVDCQELMLEWQVIDNIAQCTGLSTEESQVLACQIVMFLFPVDMDQQRLSPFGAFWGVFRQFCYHSDASVSLNLNWNEELVFKLCNPLVMPTLPACVHSLAAWCLAHVSFTESNCEKLMKWMQMDKLRRGAESTHLLVRHLCSLTLLNLGLEELNEDYDLHRQRADKKDAQEPSWKLDKEVPDEHLDSLCREVGEQEQRFLRDHHNFAPLFLFASSNKDVLYEVESLFTLNAEQSRSGRPEDLLAQAFEKRDVLRREVRMLSQSPTATPSGTATPDSLSSSSSSLNRLLTPTKPIPVDDPLFATALEVQRLRSEAEKKLRVLAQKADTGSAASASLQDMAAVVQDLTPVLALFGSPQKPSQRQQQEQSSGRQPPNVDDLDCELHTVEDSSLQGVSERFVDSLRAFSRWHNAWEEEKPRALRFTIREFKRQMREQQKRLDALVLWGRRVMENLVNVSRRFCEHRREVDSLADVFSQYRSLLWALEREELERAEMQELVEEKARTKGDWIEAQKRCNRMGFELKEMELNGTASGRELEEAAQSVELQREKVAAFARKLESIATRLRVLSDSHADAVVLSGALESDVDADERLARTGVLVRRRLDEDYEIVREIRRGVFLAKLKGDGRLCVLKEFSRCEEKIMEHEASVLSSLDHPFVVSIEAVFKDRSKTERDWHKAYIQFPYFENGTLRDFFNSPDRTPWELECIFRQIVQGLGYIHSQRIVHRDIKPDNIFISRNATPKVADFGFAKTETILPENQASEFVGTRPYASPEVLMPARSPNALSSGSKRLTLKTSQNREDSSELRSSSSPSGSPSSLSRPASAVSPSAASRCTAKSDMWSLGVMILEAHFGPLSETKLSPVKDEAHQQMIFSSPLAASSVFTNLFTPEKVEKAPVPGASSSADSLAESGSGSGSPSARTPTNNPAVRGLTGTISIPDKSQLREKLRQDMTDEMFRQLRSLLKRLLSIDPRSRPSAIELLAHPYFSTPHAHMLHKDRYLIRSDDKIRQFRQVCEEKSRDIPPIELTVSRSHIVNDVVEVFQAMNLEEDMLAPLHTHLLESTGESGEDMGAVSDDMFTEFFTQVLNPELGLFEASSGITGSDPDAELYLPAAGSDNFFAYESMGAALLKCLIDGRPVHARFAPSLFKYLLDIDPSYSDMELYDPTYAHNLREYVLRKTIREPTYLHFTSDSGEEIELREENKHEFVRKQIYEKLVGCRKTQLEAIKQGFSRVDMSLWLKGLNCTELMLLLCGEDYLDADMVLQNVRFSSSFAEGSPIPEFLMRFLRESDITVLRRFLRLCTSLTAIPYGGFRQKITAFPSSRFYAQTCFHHLEIPPFQEYSDFAASMTAAIVAVDSVGMNEDEDSVDGDFSSSDVGSSGSHLLLSPDPGRPSGSFPPSSPSPPDSVASR